MTIEIKVPPLGESVSEATIARWLKQSGEAVMVDEPVAELETDKVTLEVPSPAAGVLASLMAAEGATVAADAVLAVLEEGPAPAKTATAASGASGETPATGASGATPTKAVTPESAETGATPAPPASTTSGAASSGATSSGAMPLSPAVRRLVSEHNLNPATIPASGKDGRLTKGDVLKAIASGAAGAAKAATQATQTAPAAPTTQASTTHTQAAPPPRTDDPREERVPMTRLRKVIARRLKEAQNTAAMLTTFNEVDMSGVMALRSEYRDAFEKTYGVKLGFMGFFVKAVIEALRAYPAVNAEIHGDDIIYRNYYNIGVAVGTAQGLVVPVLKDADAMSLAETESSIAAFGQKAREGSLTMADMSHGTFTISNGGVYGSMMSTPILNPPQSGILGMHNIQKRAVVVSGKSGDEIVIRPMMYLALSYDHRIIDGREAVSFLVRIKSVIEDPRRLVLGV